MVELLTVLKERTLKLSNASPRPGNDDFTGWLPVGSRQHPQSTFSFLAGFELCGQAPAVPPWTLHRLGTADFKKPDSNTFISFIGADRV